MSGWKTAEFSDLFPLNLWVVFLKRLVAIESKSRNFSYFAISKSTDVGLCWTSGG